VSRVPTADLETAELHDSRERRFVYTGEEGTGSSDYLTRGNRPLKRRKKSPFRIVSLLVIVSALIVFYVWNKITVNRLAAETDELGKKLQTIESMNRYYKADVDKKASLERVTSFARDKMNMVPSSEPPVYFEVENYQRAPSGTEQQ
jgi:hypothetical protein